LGTALGSLRVRVSYRVSRRELGEEGRDGLARCAPRVRVRVRVGVGVRRG
jgi:hypothetical protein